MLIATAGHVDHGKTSLIRALTGEETDRLPEERARGISIDLGFAYWRPEEGLILGFVDVPGHERFVRNMLAGVGAIDFALLVVAADDGVMPQTVEHVQILDLLGIARGAAVITKCDRSPLERIREVRDEVHGLLAATSLAGLPIFEVSSATGAGISELGKSLAATARDERLRDPAGRNFRLAIDRSFSIAGAGTVVTGTVLDGSVEVGAHLMVSPRGKQARVRGLQSAGQAVAQVGPGQRCAVNLAGVEVADARRGDWLLVPAMHSPTSRIEATLRLLDSSTSSLKHHASVHLHLGTADVVARVLVPAQGAIPPGGEARVQLVLDRPSCAVTGDRFVLRDQSGRQTIGGGRVLDPFATGSGRRQAERASISDALGLADAAQALAALLALPGHEVDRLHFERSFNLEAEAARTLFHQAGAILLGGDLGLPYDRIEAIKKQVIEVLAGFHRKEPESGGMTSRDLKEAVAGGISTQAFVALQRELTQKGMIVANGPFVKLPGHVAAFSQSDSVLWQKALPLLEQRGVQAFTARELAAELHMSEAIVGASLFRRRNNGELWRITEDRFMLRPHIAGLAATVARLSRDAGRNGFTAAQYRDAIGTGRTLAIQVLEFFDNAGVTRRVGDLRWIRPDYELVVGK